MDGDEGHSINRGAFDKIKEAQGGNKGRGRELCEVELHDGVWFVNS